MCNTANTEMSNSDFLVKPDEVTKNDVTNPFEGFKTFEKRENIKPSKTWSVTFSKSVDESTIHSGNNNSVKI